jgi:hypothetical protein
VALPFVSRFSAAAPVVWGWVARPVPIRLFDAAQVARIGEAAAIFAAATFRAATLWRTNRDAER